jgi:hypothetical protein
MTENKKTRLHRGVAFCLDHPALHIKHFGIACEPKTFLDGILIRQSASMNPIATFPFLGKVKVSGGSDRI